MKEYIKNWQKNYKESLEDIELFKFGAGLEMNSRQKRLFVKLFYHARGHFSDFLWIVANNTASYRVRLLVLENIKDELGCVQRGDLPHEQLFLQFANTFDKSIRKEILNQEYYVDFLKDFNEFHRKTLQSATPEEQWALFSAYELLDTVDYEALYTLAKDMGSSKKELIFFDVHRQGDHFTSTYKALLIIWEKDQKVVRKAFSIIEKSQLAMWRRLSDEVFSLKI
jgi:hypothetical protein